MNKLAKAIKCFFSSNRTECEHATECNTIVIDNLKVENTLVREQQQRLYNNFVNFIKVLESVVNEADATNYKKLEKISCEGAFFRHDIGARAMKAVVAERKN